MIRTLTGLVLVTVGVSAAGRFDRDVRNDPFAAFQGDHARLEHAMKVCEETLAGSPDHAEALVWHGAGLFFQAGMAFRKGDQAQGIGLSARGLQEMDRAVELAPDSIAVRIPRGSALLAATRAMGPSPLVKPLLEKGLADYTRTYELQRERFDQLDGHSRGELLFGLAEGHLRAGREQESRAWFEKLAAMKDAGHSSQARDFLATGKLSGGASCVGCHGGK